MPKQTYGNQILVLVLLGMFLASCDFPATATPTPTAAALQLPPKQPVVGAGGGGASGGGNGSGGGSNGAGNGGGSISPANTPEPTKEIIPDSLGAPYEVKQVETLGGEAISGAVCSLAKPFIVLSVTPHVTFTFNFVPASEAQGKITYAYNIPSAGESHDANGKYTLSKPETNGTLHLTMNGSDHVVFKGFDGNIPFNYKFDLVPSGQINCAP